MMEQAREPSQMMAVLLVESMTLTSILDIHGTKHKMKISLNQQMPLKLLLTPLLLM